MELNLCKLMAHRATVLHASCHLNLAGHPSDSLWRVRPMPATRLVLHLVQRAIATADCYN